jgi:transposase
MKKGNRKAKRMERLSITVGIDLGDSSSSYCMLNEDGEEVERGRIKTTEAGFRRHFEGVGKYRMVMECGTHSPWVSRLLQQLGHQVIVANSRKVEAITGNVSKNDDNDAEGLAHLGHCDPFLLSPIHHRSAERQRDLNLLRARDTLVRARTMIINSVRGLVKSAGARLPKCATTAFAEKVREAIPAELNDLALPLLQQVQQLSDQIKVLDRKIEKLDERYPEIKVLRTAPGVGPLVAAGYVLTLNGVEALEESRQAGPYLGLRPRQGQSGNSDPQHRISKTGNGYLRHLLVQAGQYILGRFGPDSQLRRWGLKLASSGGKRGKKRAVVAVARKLAVILHSMWRHKAAFQPFPQVAAGKTA